MDYGEILSKAWKIIWKHKVLWIFGILAGCGSASGNSGGGGGGQGNVNYQMNGSGNLPPQFQMFINQINRFFENTPFWVWIVLALAFLVLVIIVILLTTIGRIGLIKGVNQADDGAERLSFGPLFSESLHYFWRVFLLNLMIGLAVFIVIMVLVIPMILIGAGTRGVGFVVIGPLLCICACIIIPVSWFINLVIEQSDIAIVSENLGIFPGLKRGWEVVTRNLGPFIVMLIILGIIGFVASLIVGLPMIVVALPAITQFIIQRDVVFSGGVVISLILFCIYLPILLVLNGIIQSYLTSAWTLTFRRVTSRGAHPPVVDVTPTPPVEPFEPVPPVPPVPPEPLP